MSAEVLLDREAIARACEQYFVARLQVFGSAAAGNFDSATSDFDFLVDFRADAPKGIAPFFGLQEALERIVGRKVDLVETSAIRNPYFANRAFAEAVELYAT